jgi:NosR/NirI family nitrous oxide reductase transcriptional regulator
LKRWALGAYRLGIILVALGCLRALPDDVAQLDRAVVLTHAKQVLPDVVAVGDPTDGLYPLKDETAESVGWATSTLPQAQKIQGYSGPSELLVIFDKDRKVKAVKFLASSDTDGHVEKVRRDKNFWAQWNGKSESSLGGAVSPIVVSGATLTSEAMARGVETYVSSVKEEVKYADGFAGKSVEEILPEDTWVSPSLFTSGASYTNHAVVESVREMLSRHIADEKKGGFSWKSALAISWILLGVFFGISKVGGKKSIRYGFAVVSVAAGVGLGWMVSQDQLLGWGGNGFGAGAILPLVVLTAAALMVPAFTGKNVYCSRICPHGAAQTLAGGLVKKRFHLPAKLHAVLVRLPWATLIVIWLLALIGSGLPFANFEPFETWSSGFVAFVPAAIFTIGLVAAFFLPQAYCHYGCPTGAMLKFLTQSPSAWTRKDTVAAVLIGAACLYVFL